MMVEKQNPAYEKVALPLQRFNRQLQGFFFVYLHPMTQEQLKVLRDRVLVLRRFL